MPVPPPALRLNATGTWSAIRLNFPTPCPLCAVPLLSAIYAVQRHCERSSGGIGDRPRARLSRLQPRTNKIRLCRAGSLRQEVAFPSENGLREVFWIQRRRPTEHRLSHSFFLSLFSLFLSPSICLSIYPSLFLPSFLRHRSTVCRVHTYHRCHVTQTEIHTWMKSLLD